IGMVLGALVAKVIYIDLILRASISVTEYVGAGILAAVVALLVARELDLSSASSIIAGEVRSRHIVITVSLSFAFLLVLFYLLKFSDKYSGGWLFLLFF